MKTTRFLVILIMALCMILSRAKVSNAAPMGTAFTYQGHLYDNNDVANNFYDFQFRLYDDPNVLVGQQIGNEVNVPDVYVIDGYFTVELDFGSSVFDGDACWLQIGVRPGELEEPNAYTPLVPRQAITPAPYALYAVSGTGVAIPLELTGTLASPGAVISGTNTGSGYGVYGKHDSSSHWGLLGGSNYAVAGRHDSSGNHGYIASNDYGVYGNSSSGYAGYFDGRGYFSDNVGIGTTTSSANLHIDSEGDTELRIEHDDVKNFISFYSSTTKKGYIEKDDDAGFLNISANGTNNHFSIDESSGNVGIGDTTPNQKLEVNGYVSAGRYIDRDSTNYYLDPGNAATSAVLAGNVGIGITTPDSKLHVNGEIYSTRIRTPSTQDYDKLRVWDSSSYAIGMYGNTTLGSLNGYAMTFTMSDNANWGWIWRNHVDSTSDGAMSLTTDGNLYVKGNVHVPSVYNSLGPTTWLYVRISDDGRLFTSPSSARYKDNIRPLNDDFSKILKAQPVVFNIKGSQHQEAGYIAEEFDHLGLKHLVIYDGQGRPESLRYELVSLYILEVVKEQVETVKQLKAENEQLRKHLMVANESLRQRLAAVEKMVTQQQFVSAKEVYNETH